MEVRDAASAVYRVEPEAARADDGVPSGYKLTEVGVIPEDWKLPLLQTVGTFSKGQGIRKDESNSGSIPCVRYGEIYTHHNDILRRFNSHISERVAQSSVPLRSGDILFAGSGETKEEIGKAVAYVGQGRAYAGGDIVILTPHGFASTFLGYALNAPSVVRQKAVRGQGDAVVHITSGALSSVVVPVPPTLAEQQAIAEALSDADALIESLQQLIAKQRALKQGAMQALLTGRQRLPGFTSEWQTKLIRDLLTYERPDRYIVTSTEYLETGDVPVLTANKSFILGYTNETSGICREVPVIVFDDFTTDSKIATFPFKVKSSAIKLLRPKHDRVNLKYVFERMQLIRFPLGDHRRYYISDYQNIELLWPDYGEQTAIAAVLSDMDVEIAALEERLAKTRALKAGMMQQLLTGRIRLV